MKRVADEEKVLFALVGGAKKPIRKDVNGKLQDNEIEKILIEKYANKPGAYQEDEEEVRPETIDKQAIVDEIVMDNKKYLKSLALQKRRWVGDEKPFANKDLQEWFKVYNQTQLNKAKKFLKKIKEENESKLAIGSNLVKVKLDGVAEEDDIFEDSPRFGAKDIEKVAGGAQ